MRAGGHDYWRRFACSVSIGFATIAAVAITIALVLAYGRAAQPPIFDVSDASLARFTLRTSPGDGPTNITYNLTLTVAVRNPNWAMGAAFRSLEADLLFDGQRFGRAPVVVPAAGSAAVVVVQAGEAAAFPVVAGGVMNLANGNASVGAYRRQSRAGVFDVLVGFCGRVRYRPHAVWCRLEVSCGPLRLKLGAHGGGAGAGDDRNGTTACKVLSPQGGC